jgi:predicted PhzF superfamily epimerase YddE/YHI9
MRGAGAVLIDDGNTVEDVSPNLAALPHLFEKRNVNCAKVTGVLAVIKILGPPATSFCRSFVQSPGVTTEPPATVTATA